MFNKFVLNRKNNLFFRIISLSLIALTILFAMLSYSRDLGTYVFNHGSTVKNIIATADEKGALAFAFTGTIKEPIIDNYLFGDSSSLTVAIALIIVSLMGALAQIVKLFNPRYINVNFVNSLVILIALVIAVGFSSVTSVLVLLLLAVAVQSVLLYTSVLVEFRKNEFIGKLKFQTIK